MTADNEKLNLRFFKEPGTAAYEFAASLAANRIGHGMSLGFYRKIELEKALAEFFSQGQITAEALEEMKSWIETLPWDENSRMAFSLTW